jgi:hypothetical protein
VVRIVLVPLIVLGPLGALVVSGVLFPSAPYAVVHGLLVLSFFYTIVAMIVVPALFWAPGSSSGRFGEGGDGGDIDPPQPPAPPDGPRGGIPLPDADQARGRVRGHDPTGRRWVPARRTSREPEREPVLTLPVE